MLAKEMPPSPRNVTLGVANKARREKKTNTKTTAVVVDLTVEEWRVISFNSVCEATLTRSLQRPLLLGVEGAVSSHTHFRNQSFSQKDTFTCLQVEFKIDYITVG